ncbi:MAG: BON domain-containing protein [Gammaproteobacteria bacterium]|nr:BON domain-containing protein [Gammaproteobacteria bacterium]
MQIKTFTGFVVIAAAATMAACTTRPVTIDTPGPGATTIQVPVPATPDIALSSRVKAALNSGMGSNAAGIDVRAENGTIFLTGRVATRALHDQAVAIARGTADVRAVVHTGLVVG